MNVLVLHKMGDPKYWRESVRSLEYMIPECQSDLNCIVHDIHLPFPNYLKQINYHLIILGPTFLCVRYRPNKLEKIFDYYDFIRHSSACKIALPQDDYDCSQILDEWMTDWKIDRVYSVCPPEYWNILYPKYTQQGEIHLGYTGYISDKWITSWQHPRPNSQRKIDVSYRASKLPANFGSVGYLKGEIADRFIYALPKNHRLKLDISVKAKDLIPGHHWHEFIENSKFCLATPSGSSLLDQRGLYRKSVQQFNLTYPNANFDTIKANCFPGEDQKYLFLAISPRNIEAALAETVQIATPGTYSGLMRPNEHLIPLAEDCSNIKDVLEMMTDENLITNIKKACKESMLSEPRLRRNVFVNELINYAENVLNTKKEPIKATHQDKTYFKKYYDEIRIVANKHWYKWRIIRFCYNLA
ncbi:hypothetical protein TI03_03695, partial [Achromatium sp. WMS1]